jgi:hypothetical protein
MLMSTFVTVKTTCNPAGKNFPGVLTYPTSADGPKGRQLRLVSPTPVKQEVVAIRVTTF